MSWDIEAFREKIETGHTFPGLYLFKFIVPAAQKERVLSILPKSEISIRSSSNNTYISITSHAKVHSSAEVLEVYIEANKIEGCIVL